jgi:hypothetical protein
VKEPGITADEWREADGPGLKDIELLQLRSKVIRLARLCRLGRRVTERALLGSTKAQCRAWIEDMERVRANMLKAEQERWTPEQRIQEFEKLKRKERQIEWRRAQDREHAAERQAFDAWIKEGQS